MQKRIAPVTQMCPLIQSAWQERKVLSQKAADWAEAESQLGYLHGHACHCWTPGKLIQPQLESDPHVKVYRLFPRVQHHVLLCR